MKILVTGGAGFIGSHLCEDLVLTGHEVTSLDNYSTGSINNHVDGVNYVKGETKNIQNLINFSPDIIYHLGEYSRVEQSFKDIQIVWSSNKDGIFSVLEFSRNNGAKLIYAGSSTKFGDDGIGKTQSPYAWSKSSNTELVKCYGDWFGLNYAITYFYNVYGGREISSGEYATLIAIFIKQYKSGKKLSVVSPGSQLRNFTHIDDIISGLVLVGNSGYGDNYGIGNSESFSVLEIARMFGSDFHMLPERAGNRMKAKLITDKTSKLGWSASKSVRQYIKNIIQDK
jgi:UDP-glucose 4-epimerase